jgi:hypothetical protein
MADVAALIGRNGEPSARISPTVLFFFNSRRCSGVKHMKTSLLHALEETATRFWSLLLNWEFTPVRRLDFLFVDFMQAGG